MVTIRDIKRTMRPILKRNKVVKAGIFGSYARGEQSKKSDVDILIQFKGRKSLLDLVKLKHELEDTIKKKVDLLTYRSVHPLLKAGILHEEVRILDEKRQKVH